MKFWSSQRIQKLGLPLVVVALFSLLGGHYATVQTVAWATMLWSYSQEERSFLAGVEKTFSGKAPCEMCTAVKTSREKEEREVPAPLKVEKKAEAPIAFRRITLPLPGSVFARLEQPSAVRLVSRAEAPPAPVPLG